MWILWTAYLIKQVEQRPPINGAHHSPPLARQLLIQRHTLHSRDVVLAARRLVQEEQVGYVNIVYVIRSYLIKQFEQ